ncbi:MAG: photosystem II protein Psb27 [Cyanobacteria bacterium P01_G01_bin.54]
MRLRPLLSRLLALVLVLWMSVMSAAPAIASDMTGNYRQDTLTMLEEISIIVNSSEDTPEVADVRAKTRTDINDYVARYRRDAKYKGLRSFTTMQTALNSLAGFYSSYGNRPLSAKLTKRLKQEFRQVEISLKRGL